MNLKPKTDGRSKVALARSVFFESGGYSHLAGVSLSRSVPGAVGELHFLECPLSFFSTFLTLNYGGDGTNFEGYRGCSE